MTGEVRADEEGDDDDVESERDDRDAACRSPLVLRLAIRTVPAACDDPDLCVDGL